MHWFVTDETNKNSVPGQFFIYGGLVATDEQTLQIDAEVSRIRDKFGYRPGDSFKFQTAARPAHVPIDKAREAKQELIETLVRLGVRMITYVILHDIAASRSEEEVTNFALNTVTQGYHSLLEEEECKGVMLIDRADEQHAHLGSLFQKGLSSDKWHGTVSDRIVLFGMTSDNASHLSSAVDIALGAFRYCVNTAGGAGLEVVAEKIFPPLAELIYGRDVSGVKHIGEKGYFARPKDVRKPTYEVRYRELAEALQKYAAQQ